MNKKALVILAQGHEEIEAITPIDLLRRSGVDVTVAGLGNAVITGAHGITVQTDCTLDTFRGTTDAVVLPGGMPGTTNLMSSPTVLTIIRNAFEIGSICAAICAAPRVLDAAGVLAGKKFTCYPGVEKNIKNAIFSKDTVVRDGIIITSRGAGTACAFSLAIIEALCGKQAAIDCAQKIVYTIC